MLGSKSCHYVLRSTCKQKNRKDFRASFLLLSQAGPRSLATPRNIAKREFGSQQGPSYINAMGIQIREEFLNAIPNHHAKVPKQNKLTLRAHSEYRRPRLDSFVS